VVRISSDLFSEENMDEYTVFTIVDDSCDTQYDEKSDGFAFVWAWRIVHFGLKTTID
jgi:hypothetical protein